MSDNKLIIKVIMTWGCPLPTKNYTITGRQNVHKSVNIYKETIQQLSNSLRKVRQSQ